MLDIFGRITGVDLYNNVPTNIVHVTVRDASDADLKMLQNWINEYKDHFRCKFVLTNQDIVLSQEDKDNG